MQDILDKTTTLTRREIKKRWPALSKDETEKRALTVALAAIIYGDLKNNKKNNVIFDLKKFTSFDGDTGPYILYTYARASSIIKKAEKKAPTSSKFEIKDLEDKELALVNHLSKFQETILDAFVHLNPSIVAGFCYQACQKFNEFYQQSPVIGSENEAFRLALVEAFRIILRNALHLLGINAIEEM